MKNVKKIIFLILFNMLILLFPATYFAHPGRTDSSGGHHDYQNRSGLGSYHYHHGMGPHLHPGGVCPYAPKDIITIKSYKSTMYAGDKQTINYSIESVSYSYPDISSSNEDVISVSDNKLIAKKPGTSTITIETQTASKSFTVTVKEVYAEDIKISIPSKKLQLGDSMMLKTKIIPRNTTNKNLKFESSDPSIVKVSKNGKLVGKSCGKATITITTSNNISKSFNFKVYEVKPESIECNSEINLIVGEQCDFLINISPENANKKDYNILIKDENIIEYNDKKNNCY